jgi:hypothetical protein
MLKKLAISATNLQLKLKKPFCKVAGDSKSCSDLNESQIGVPCVQLLNETNLKPSKSLKSLLQKHISKNKKAKTNLAIEEDQTKIKKCKDRNEHRKELVLDLKTEKLIDSIIKIELLKIENKVEEVQQRVIQGFKTLEDRGLKLEDLLLNSEKLNQSCQDLMVVTQKTRKVFITNDVRRNILLVLALILFVILSFGNIYFLYK